MVVDIVLQIFKNRKIHRESFLRCRAGHILLVLLVSFQSFMFGKLLNTFPTEVVLSFVSLII